MPSRAEQADAAALHRDELEAKVLALAAGNGNADGRDGVGSAQEPGKAADAGDGAPPAHRHPALGQPELAGKGGGQAAGQGAAADEYHGLGNAGQAADALGDEAGELLYRRRQGSPHGAGRQLVPVAEDIGKADNGLAVEGTLYRLARGEIQQVLPSQGLGDLIAGAGHHVVGDDVAALGDGDV